MHPAEANAAAPKANSLLVILFYAKGSAPVLLDNPVLSHMDIIPKTRLLHHFYCINKLRPLILLILLLHQ
jgi:hypothetical protein